MAESTNHFSDFFAPDNTRSPDEADTSFVAVRSVKRSLLAELRNDTAGTAPRLESLLARWPTDPRQDRDAASVLFEDFQQRSRRGEAPDREEYEERFPDQKDSLAVLFRRQDFLESVSAGSSASGPTLALPNVGDELFGFRLRHALGSGAFARVYLAEQADLAGRPVVLKVSDTDGDEPQTLAQMQHTNIVPIYSVHEDATAGLRAVCMPYFGGASLSCVLTELWKGATPPLRGEQIVQALAAVGGPSLAPTSELPAQDNSSQGVSAANDKQKECQVEPGIDQRGQLAQLGRLDYLRAAVWIVSQLADGLQHAHQRGVCHRDVKPSNILLGADGQPMLLDFNLAHHMSSAKAQASASLGGTIAYMAPEHLRALAARDAALARLVDQRSDIYALGMVLFEMLAGRSPFQQSASYVVLPVVIEAMAVERGRKAPSPRAQGIDIPWGLESILRKCLAPDPRDRYQQAADFAEDLRRFLDDLPLRHAPELSRVERLRKWLRRHPRVTSSGSIATAAAALLVAAGASLAGVRGHLEHTREELAATQGRERRQMFDRLKTRAFCFVNTTIDGQDNLTAGLGVLEQVLGLYGVLDRPDWQEHPDWHRLEAQEQRQLAEDIRELLLLLAWARVKLLPPAEVVTSAERTALQDALALLERAEAVPGLAPSPALYRARARYLERLGDKDGAQTATARASNLRPAGPRDHYLLATAHLRGGDSGRHVRALRELDRAIELAPDRPDYWTHMQRGICHLELKHYQLAAADFGTCVGIWPEFAWGHFNRGLAHDLAGRKAEAIADYGAAVRLHDGFLHAWWNRGIAQLEVGQAEGALPDLRRAAALGRDDAPLYLALGKALEKLAQPTEADEAFKQLLTRLPAEPGARARYLCDYGFTILNRVPARAEAAFRDVLAATPRDRLALYGLGMAAVESGREADGIAYFSWALEFHPDFLDARSCRAVLFARRGDFPRAGAEIDRALRQDRTRGATFYDAACVMAWASRHRGYLQVADQCRDRAVAYLKEAFARDVGRDKAAHDPDLAALRDHAGFKRLLASGAEHTGPR